ncbi:FecCD family ABC transporter permease [Acerihabitans arboris]|uniref:Iron chelate uptake ABC transporter family permease subunit n=1 Tax=Acerihabitans arboris TaxID=2691583 RepID=A0A845SJC2_9GAMM|nr:iron ABC transporter permease [Acerihabitans arboris]NDL63357.1 iron chelate uptake ABC transporter family permease subunit [Acerihabitans arboris]
MKTFYPLRLGPLSLLLRPPVLMLCALLLAGVLLAAAAGVTQGSLPVPGNAILRALFYPGDGAAEQRYIVWDIRLPRMLTGLLCGAMLGMAGAAMQSITRNGLADPGLIGVKEGTSAVVLTLVIFFPALSLIWRPLAGMAGGLLVAMLVMGLARDFSRPRFILVGIGVSWAFSAAIGAFMTTADIRDVQTALVWMAGSLHAATWGLLGITAFWGLLGGVTLYATARASDVALLGDEAATGLGVRLRALALLRFTAPVLITAASVACVGSLGFVGLIAPHMARFVLRGGQVSLLSGSALLGALLVLVTDNVGRLAFAPLQIPAGIVMSLVGGPFFLLLLWRRRDRL